MTNKIENSELFQWKNEIIWKNPEKAINILSQRIEYWVENTWKIFEIWEKVAQLDKKNTWDLNNLFTLALEKYIPKKQETV